MTQFTMCYCPCHGHAPHCLCCWSRPSSCTPCVTPIAHAMVMHVVACTLRCLCPSLPTPFITHTLHRPHPSSPTPFIACTVCHATHRPCCVSRPSPVPWSWTSSHVPCVVPLVTCTMCCACCPCCGHAPRCAHRVSRPLSHVPCIMPLTCAMVMHLVTHAMCCAPCRTHHVLLRRDTGFLAFLFPRSLGSGVYDEINGGQ